MASCKFDEYFTRNGCLSSAKPNDELAIHIILMHLQFMIALLMHYTLQMKDFPAPILNPLEMCHFLQFLKHCLHRRKHAHVYLRPVVHVPTSFSNCNSWPCNFIALVLKVSAFFQCQLWILLIQPNSLTNSAYVQPGNRFRSNFKAVKPSLEPFSVNSGGFFSFVKSSRQSMIEFTTSIIS